MKISRAELKARGAFFTPKPIAEFLAEKTLWNYIQHHEPKLNGFPDFDAFLAQIDDSDLGEGVLSILRGIKVLDPAVGDGIFLSCMADLLLSYRKQLDDPINISEIQKSIISLNLFGLDRNPSSIENSKQVFKKWLVLSNEINPPISIFKNFKVGNSLIGLSESLSPHSRIDPNSDSELNTEFLSYLQQSLGIHNIDSSQILALQPFHWTSRSSRNTFPSKFDIIIGNPPFGNILDPLEKKILSRIYQKSMVSDISKVFVRKIFDLTNEKAMVGLILPKSSCFYSSWEDIRKFLLRKEISLISDVGLGFTGVDFEQIMLVFSMTLPSSNKMTIFRATAIRPVASKIFEKIGEISQDLFSSNGVLLFSSLNPTDLELIQQINKCELKLKDITTEIHRSLYIPNKEKATLLPGSTIFINKVPDVALYRIKRVQCITLDDKYHSRMRRIKRPKIFFKVLRGRRLVAYPDLTGTLVPTEKLVCTIFPPTQESKILAYLNQINGLIPSYYLQKMLFSDTRETSRVMDSFYVGRIPLQSMNALEERISSRLTAWLLVLNQLDQDELLLETPISRDQVELLSSLSLLFSSTLYLKSIYASKFNVLIENLKDLPDTPILTWFKTRWTCPCDPRQGIDTVSRSLSQLNKYLAEFEKLLTDIISQLKKLPLITHLLNYFSIS